MRWKLSISEKPIESSAWVDGTGIFVGTFEGLAKVRMKENGGRMKEEG